jgi:hypothetical protein
VDLVDRYLQAVRSWLPHGQQDDILAELAEDLRSEIDDRQAQVGHPLSDAEIAAILRKRGHPMVVGNRYVPPRYLIGPSLFPIYWFVLKIVAFCYVVPWVLVKIGLLIVAVEQGTWRGWGSEVAIAWAHLCLAMLVATGVVTTVFALIEWLQSSPRLLETWNPLKLPPVRDAWRIPRLGSAIEIAVSVVILILLTNDLRSTTIFDRAGVTVVVAPIWRTIFACMVSGMLAGIALSSVNLVRPYWTWLRAGLRLVLDGVGAAIFCSMFKVDLLAEIHVPNLAPARALELVNSINMVASRMFPFVVLASVLIVGLSGIGRLIRLRARSGRIANSAVPVANGLH